MPFTLSHPAAAALIRPALRRFAVPLASVAIGSMSPDFEFALHLRPVALISHTLLGLFVFCVPAGLLVWWTWDEIVRAPLGALFSVRVTEAPPRTMAVWTRAGAGVLIGAVTHLLWDGVTHGNYWGATVFPWLLAPAVTVSGVVIPWFNLLQHLSTLFGGLLVLAWGAAYVRARGNVAELRRPSWRWRAIAGIVVATMLTALANGSRGPFGAGFWTEQRLLGRIAVGGLIGGAGAVLVFALLYRRSRSDPARAN